MDIVRLLKPKPVTIALSTFVVVSVVWSGIKAWLPPHSSNWSNNTYSGRAVGHRALYELIERLHGRVIRGHSLPPESFSGKRRVVLLEPEYARVEIEGGYLTHMLSWLQDGGELVVVSDQLDFESRDESVWTDEEETSEEEEDELDSEDASANENELEKEDELEKEGDSEKERADEERKAKEEKKKEDSIIRHPLLARLGLDDLKIEPEPRDRFKRDQIYEYAAGRTLKKHTWWMIEPEVTYTLHGRGTLEGACNGLDSIKLPKGQVPHFTGASVEKARGAIVVESAEGIAPPIALAYPMGLGQVIFVSDPSLFGNIGIAEGDNSVLAYRLAVGDGSREVVLDEYYHRGLPYSGNIFAVFGVYPYWVALLGVLVATLVWAWSCAVRFGPPAPERPPSRRNILEYVDAMANLFRRGRKNAFVLSCVRDGFLDEIREELFLAPGSAASYTLDRLRSADRVRAERLQSVLGDIETSLLSKRLAPKQLSELYARLESCREAKKRHSPMLS